MAILDATTEINKIFLPVHDSPWEAFDRSLLDELGFYRSTLVFYRWDIDWLATVLPRSVPHDDRFRGNFPCNKSLVEWLAIEARAGHVHGAYIATVETLRSEKFICCSTADAVAERLLGRVEPFRSQRTGDEYYWLTDNLHPARFTVNRREFRRLRERPGFLDLED